MAGTTTSLSMLGGSGDTIRVDAPTHAMRTSKAMRLQVFEPWRL